MGLNRSVFLILSVILFVGLCVSQECEDTSEEFLVGWNKMSCSEMIKKELHQCYNPVYMEKCCKSCQSAKSETEGCEYGNRVPQWCMASEQDVCPRDDLRDNCCEKCKKYIAAKGCEDKMNEVNIRSDKMSCPDMAEKETSFCYAKFFNGLCCESCEKKKYDKEGCEYGDKNLKFCKTRKATDCYNAKETCCKTCAAFETGEAGCEYGDKAAWCRFVTAKQCEDRPDYRDVCCKTCKSVGSVEKDDSGNENEKEPDEIKNETYKVPSEPIDHPDDRPKR